MGINGLLQWHRRDSFHTVSNALRRKSSVRRCTLAIVRMLYLRLSATSVATAKHLIAGGYFLGGLFWTRVAAFRPVPGAMLRKQDFGHRRPAMVHWP